MADYKFAIRCWQDQAGDANAKANIFLNGTQVVTEQEITATSADSPQLITFDGTGIADPSESTTVTIKVSLANEYYVDGDTDRNIWINGIGSIIKEADNSYKKWTDNTFTTLTTADTSNLSDYANIGQAPTSVTGDQIPDGFWADNTIFESIPVWGNANDSDAGVTIVFPIKEHRGISA